MSFPVYTILDHVGELFYPVRLGVFAHVNEIPKTMFAVQRSEQNEGTNICRR